MIAVHPAPDVFLAPGELVVVRSPANIRTVVGSCVAICLWDGRRRVGGLNHYLQDRKSVV